MTKVLTQLKLGGALLLVCMFGDAKLFSQTPAEPTPADAKQNTSLVPAAKAQIQPADLLRLAAVSAGKIADAGNRSYALIKVAEAQAKNGQREESKRSFALATTAVDSILHEEAWTCGQIRKTALMNIYASQSKLGFFDDALRTANNVNMGDSRVWVYSEIAKAQASKGDIKAALKTVEISPELGKSASIGWVVGPIAASGDVKLALAMAEETNTTDRTRALTEIALAQFRAGKRDEAKQILDKAIKFADGLSVEPDNNGVKQKLWAMELIGKAQIEMGDEPAALATAESIKEASWVVREKIVAGVAIRRAKAGQIAEAQKAIEGFKTCDWVKSEIVGAQARAGDFHGARQTIESMRYKRRGLAEVASVRLKSGNRKVATELFHEALNLEGLDLDREWLNGDPFELNWIISHWAERGGEEEARAWIEQQESPFVKAIALVGIVDGIVNRREWEEKSPDRAVP